MTIIIDGTIIQGARVASKNIRFQMPHLVWQFPVIKDIYPASINVRLTSPLRTLRWDHITLPIPWWDVDEHNPGRWVSEKFGFLEIGFEYTVGTHLRRAWSFDCHNSASHSDAYRFEVISEKIEGLSYNQPCKVHIEESKILG